MAAAAHASYFQAEHVGLGEVALPETNPMVAVTTHTCCWVLLSFVEHPGVPASVHAPSS
jgi:hypothetical protein